MIRLPLLPRSAWLSAALLAASLLTPSALAQFIQTGAGPYDYNTTANWNGGFITGTFSGYTPSAAQAVTFAADTILSTGLTFNLGGASLTELTLRASGTDRTVTLGGDVSVSGTSSAITFGSTTTGNKLDFALGGVDRTFTIGTGTLLTVNNVISGSNALTKAGAGQVTLAGTNTYTGTTTINNGILYLNASGTLPAASNIVVNATAASTTAQLVLGVGFFQTVGSLTLGGAGGTTSSTNTVTLNSGSILTLDGTVTFNGTTGPLTSVISGGSLALSGNRTFNVIDSATQNADLNISSNITGTSYSLTKTGTGRLQLTGTNSYAGGTILNGGVLFIGASTALASTGPVTINNLLNTTSTLGVNAGTAVATNTIGALTFGGAGSSSGAQNDIQINISTLILDGTVTYDATNNPKGSTISPLSTGALALGTARTFDIGNSSTTTNELTISAPVSGGSLTKTGAGTLRLSGVNTYSGGTIVSGGGLNVANTGSTTSGTGTSTVTIQTGATLRGSGFIAGVTTIQSGGIMGTAGTSDTPATLTFTGGLTLNDGAVFNFQLGTASDKFVITGGLLTGAATSGMLTINLTAGSGFTAGTYTLFDYSTGATMSGFDLADFTLGTTIAGYTSSLAIAGNKLQLTAIPEPATYAAIFGGVSLLGAAIYRRRGDKRRPYLTN